MVDDDDCSPDLSISTDPVEHATNTIAAIMSTMLSAMFGVSVEEERVMDVVRAAYETADTVYTLQHALQYADGFTVPQEVFDSEDYRL